MVVLPLLHKVCHIYGGAPIEGWYDTKQATQYPILLGPGDTNTQ